MKFKQLRSFVIALSCVAVVLPPVATAAPAVKSVSVAAPAHRDVALHQGGVLVGQMLDAQGAAIAGVAVSVRSAGKVVARAETNQAGKFQVAGLKGGVHQVVAAGHQDICRLWAPQTAPPAAQHGLLLVSSEDLVRGQGCGSVVPNCGSGCGAGGGYGRGGGGGGVGNWIANHPIITAGAVAAAIAIPLAVDDDDAPATP